MSVRRSVAAVLVCAAVLVPSASASASAAHSTGTPEQVAWVRRAATNFVNAELSGNGAGACGILNAPLRATQHHRTCAQRWDAKLTTLLHKPGGRAQLRAQKRAIPSAAVVVHDNIASLELATPLMNGSNQMVWTENCWMVRG
ncbi:MAG: hypothetical protein ACLP7W_12410 [Solirubrobacteraceae bacterium]